MKAARNHKNESNRTSRVKKWNNWNEKTSDLSRKKKIRELEDNSIETIQSEWDKKNGEKCQEPRDLWYAVKHINIYIMELKKWEEREGQENIERNNGWKLPKFNEKYHISEKLKKL